MTDNEIIKALEYCGGITDGVKKCSDCPLLTLSPCTTYLCKNALDLINRQRVENSNLTSNLTSLQNDLTSAKAEVERLKKENKILSKNADTAFQDGLNEAQDLYAKQIENEIKAKAIKEFAERLKAQEFESGVFGASYVRYIVDNLVKETVGNTQ